MQVELAFGVVDVGHPPGAHSGLLELPIPRIHCGGFSVFGRWFVVVIHFNSLAPEVIDVDSPFADIGNIITTSNPERIDFSGHSSSRSLIMTTTRSAILLTRKWHCGGHSHREVKLHNVELTSIIDFGNAHDVTPLLLPVDNPLPPADDKHIRELTLIVVRPFRSNSLARVEKLSLASAKGANAGGEGLANHGRNVTIADSLVWYLRIPTVEMAASSKTNSQQNCNNHDEPDCRCVK
jgi:hypothetical protein